MSRIKTKEKSIQPATQPAVLSATEKPAEPEQKTTPAKCWGIWTCVKRIPRWICGFFIAVFVAVIAAIVIDIFADLGWLDSIKAFIYNILSVAEVKTVLLLSQ